MYTVEDFKNGLKKLYSEYDLTDYSNENTIHMTTQIFEEGEPNEYGLSFSAIEIKSILTAISKDSRLENNFFFTNNSVETIVEYQRRPLSRLNSAQDKYMASDSGYEINIGCASKEFIVAYICAFSDPDFKGIPIRVPFFFYEIKCLDDLRTRAHIDTIKLAKDVICPPKVRQTFGGIFYGKKRNKAAKI